VTSKFAKLRKNGITPEKRTSSQSFSECLVGAFFCFFWNYILEVYRGTCNINADVCFVTRKFAKLRKNETTPERSTSSHSLSECFFFLIFFCCFVSCLLNYILEVYRRAWSINAEVCLVTRKFAKLRKNETTPERSTSSQSLSESGPLSCGS